MIWIRLSLTYLSSALRECLTPGTSKALNSPISSPQFTLCWLVPAKMGALARELQLPSLLTLGSLRLSSPTAKRSKAYFLHWIQLKASGSNWKASYEITLTTGEPRSSMVVIGVRVDADWV